MSAPAPAREPTRDALREQLTVASPEPLDDATIAALVELARLLASTPAGVTAIHDAAESLERHVLDALAGLPHVDAAPAGPLADVGSGGGIPAIVLALARPQRAVHAIEATARKAAFIEEAARVTGARVAVHAERSETLAGGPLRDAFACVCARALAPPPVAAELCLPLCQPGGRVVLWAGETAHRAATATAARQVGGDLLAEPAERFIVLAKRAPTPARFPRRPGMAAKRPLAG